MDPTDFICALLRQNTDALGFIPRPTIEHRFVPRNLYILQRNRFRKPIGYLLHGPVHTDGRLFIHQTCIDLDRRNRGFGRQALRTLIDRAARNGANRITLRCAADLDAVAFWAQSGFLRTHITTGGARRNRTIIHFELRIPQA